MYVFGSWNALKGFASRQRVVGGMQVVSGTMGVPTATVKMVGPDGITRLSTGMGTGPVDAAYKAIDSLVRVQVCTAHPPSFPFRLPLLSWPSDTGCAFV